MPLRPANTLHTERLHPASIPHRGTHRSKLPRHNSKAITASLRIPPRVQGIRHNSNTTGVQRPHSRRHTEPHRPSNSSSNTAPRPRNRMAPHPPANTALPHTA